MSAADGSLWFAFNGEIYNYLELRDELTAEFGARFNTQGDGEANVAAYHYWGQAAVATRRADRAAAGSAERCLRIIALAGQ